MGIFLNANGTGLCGGTNSGCLLSAICSLFLFIPPPLPVNHWGIGGLRYYLLLMSGGTGNSYIAERLSAVVIPFCYLSNRTNLKENQND